MPISVAIISNVSSDILINSVCSLAPAVDEVCIGVNGSSFDKVLFYEKVAAFKNVKLFDLPWQGYGQTKNDLQELCTNDWIFSLDSDESPSENLILFLEKFLPRSDVEVFEFKRFNFIGDKMIRYGSWGNDNIYVPRLFNRKYVQWNTDLVHEDLILDKKNIVTKVPVDKYINHFTAINIDAVKKKNTHYARLSAQLKFDKGGRASIFKKYISAGYTFLKSYFLLNGWLDGIMGFRLAIEQARYSFNKYKFLNEFSN